MAMLIPALAHATGPSLPRDSVLRVVRAAERGDADAMNVLGGWYYRGIGLEQDYTTAARLWATAADKGNVAAIGNLGLCYQTGNGVQADSLRAAGLYERSVRQGNKALFTAICDRASRNSMFDRAMAGYMYAHGIGCRRDRAKAAEYLTPVARAGSMSAIRELGLVLLNDKKPGEAVKWFKRGAVANDRMCQFYYGELLTRGDGVAADPTLGFVYTLKAAEAGMPAAQYAVGRDYLDGLGTTRSREKASEWLRLASDNGYNRARRLYADLLIADNDVLGAAYVFNCLYADGRSYGRQFAAMMTPGDSTSVTETPFGHFMQGLKALTVMRDYAAAEKEFKAVKKARVAAGDVMAAYVLSVPGYKKHNYKKSVKELSKLAPKDVLAAYLLGRMYETGAEATGRDSAKALEYLESAGARGFAPALCALGDIYYEGRTEGADRERAMDYYRRAYELKMMTAMSANRYADMLEAGDPETAKAVRDYKFPGGVEGLCGLIP